MPFGPLLTPSIGLGLLAAHLRLAGVPCETLYLNLEFARRLGAERYAFLAEGATGSDFLAGDWIFRDALFGAADHSAVEAYLELLERRAVSSRWASAGGVREVVLAAREAATAFLEHAFTAVLATEPAIVGFTSIFQQHVASLALAQRIKSARPQITIVFGGANVEAVMGRELVDQFLFVDYVVSGEGDVAFPELVAAIGDNRNVHIPGVLRRGSLPAALTAPRVDDLDRLPIPDYGPYFARAREAEFLAGYQLQILFETARGCWWGERSHCTFCGLNGSTMHFRSKSAERAFREYVSLTSAYPSLPVSVVDNILDFRYFENFLPMLAAAGGTAPLFYEVKANLRKEQLRQLRAANVRSIQPGIESLHDSVLRLMRKGVSALQNIQLLKWCHALGIEVHWNIITGFPGEDPLAYAEMAQLIAKIRHLTPPGGISALRLDRFSPLFDDAEAHGISAVRPAPAYDFIYAELTPDARTNLAYHFAFAHRDGRDVNGYTAELVRAVHEWQMNRSRYAFFSVGFEHGRLLCDFRDDDDPTMVMLDAFQARVYEAFDAARTPDQAMNDFCDSGHVRDDMLKELDAFVARSFMVRQGERYLSLAVSTDERAPDVDALLRMRDYLSSHGDTGAEYSRVPVTPLHAGP